MKSSWPTVRYITIRSIFRQIQIIQYTMQNTQTLQHSQLTHRFRSYQDYLR